MGHETLAQTQEVIDRFDLDVKGVPEAQGEITGQRTRAEHGGYLRKFPDGTVIWTSPTGKVYPTSPGGTDLFPDMPRPACQEPKPIRRNRSRERAARIARIRNRNVIHRPINEAHRRLQQARRREIDYRQTRNRMRKTLFILKGRPSTSPLLQLDQRPPRTRRAATRLATPPEPPPGPTIHPSDPALRRGCGRIGRRGR